MINHSRFVSALSVMLCGSMLGGCAMFDRLGSIGEQPALSAIENPITQPGYKPVHMPMPAPQPASYSPNSLWRNGSRAFFKDQRAHQIGDILTVKVNLNDRATIDNQTKRSRENVEDSTISNFFGKAKLPIANTPLPGQAVHRRVRSPPATAKARSIARKRCRPTLPAWSRRLLPNGNLVVEGKQEVRVNFEIRELIVTGVVRPEDIESDNTIELEQDRASPHRLRRPRTDHGRPAAALRPAGARRHPALLAGHPPAFRTRQEGFRAPTPLAPQCKRRHPRPPAAPPPEAAFV